MEFKNGSELLDLCHRANSPISEIMIRREMEVSEISREEVLTRMEKSLNIMEKSVQTPLKSPGKSMGGLIGGEAALLNNRIQQQTSLCGAVLSKALMYSMATLEVNASMGMIVAAPTAGSSGVIPGLLLSLKETYNLSTRQILNGLFTSGAVGYLLMRNASVSGAEAGCQAEVGSASAMAAAAATEIMGGSPEQCLSAASTALANLLGLVCDPIAGLVEVPCQSRNGMGAANALICAEQALSGIVQLVPFDEMAECMYKVGKSIPYTLRETALGGCAATPTGCQRQCEIFSK